eukprot:768598-Hanusia_phi.AAC.3
MHLPERSDKKRESRIETGGMLEAKGWLQERAATMKDEAKAKQGAQEKIGEKGFRVRGTVREKRGKEGEKQERNDIRRKRRGAERRGKGWYWREGGKKRNVETWLVEES